MATLYLRCGTGVSSFVIHSKSSSAYPKTVTATSYTAYTGFAANSSDAYISDVVYKSGYSSATIYSSTTGTEWSVSSDPYISLGTYSTRYAEVRATSSPTVYRVSCSSGTGISKFTYLNSTTSGTGSTVTSAGVNVGSSGGYLYLKDFTFESGYGYPVTVTCSNPSNTWTINSSTTGDRYISPPSSGGTRSATLTATPKTSYTLTCYFDSEINSATFDNGTTVTRREGWGSMTYDNDVKITDISLSGSHSDWNGRIYWRSHNGTTSYYIAQIVNGNVIMRGSSYQEAISCTGNRSIDIYAEITVTKKYRVHAFGNGGTTSGGASESWWPLDQSYWESDDASFDFPLSRLPTFTKPNASFLGWAYGSTPTAGETAYTTTIQLSAAEGGTTNNLHVVWESYTYTLKYDANGGSNPPADQTYGPTADRSHSFVIPYKLPTRANYLFIGWASTSTATEAGYHPGDSASVLNTSPNQTRTLYAVWKSKVGVESHFYWYNRDDPTMTDAEKEAFDYTKIRSGLTREMTAVMWAAFADKTERLARLCGTSVSVAKPSRGTNMFASQYNNGVYALQVIANTIYSSAYIPNTVTSDVDWINASQFHGSASIKACLNKLIDDYNNGGGNTYDS